jgi:dihydropteroate synthase
MGVLNVTPDSFSDGGRWTDRDVAIARGLEMRLEGAEIIDVGGESTRPGATPVPLAEELSRVLPVIEALAEGGPVSVDTRKPEVARAAVAAGAAIINDVSARLWPVAAELGCGWVAMHMPADPAVMQRHAHYQDVVREVRDYLVERAESARAAGVDPIWIDPGIGFGKMARHNLELLGRLEVLVATGWPVLVGTSRKSFLGSIASRPGEEPVPPEDRLEGSVATAVWSVLRGADVVRVHDVRATVMAVQLAKGSLAGPPHAPEAAGRAGAAKVSGGRG